MTSFDVNTSGLDRKIAVDELMHGKRRIQSKFGFTSAYLLRNGWVARRVEPDNNWSRSAYWTIYLSREDYEKKHAFAGAPNRLDSALDIALRKQAGEFKDEPINPDLI